MEEKKGKPGAWTRFSDIAVALAVVGMIVIMIVPLTPGALDVLLASNLALTLVILLVALHTTDPLHFSVFPSLLLVVTLYRLALNISGTRLILLHAHAGLLINAFGNVVVEGSYVVGAVVFLILVIIQFVVVTSGAQRVAEVAARFTLDAMPGKQMSIDADLNAGAITDVEARRRRRAIEDEADFYGAMDGASKFVRGDAIAAVIIILVNVLGGLVIGVLQKGMSLMEALQTYTLLTVGEGLVTQIPALLVSTATGIVVTRAASNANLGEDLTSQLLAKPRALAIASCLMLTLLVVPGLPRVPFLLIGTGLGTGAWVLGRKAGADADAVDGEGNDPRAADLSDALDLDPLEMQVGSALLPMVERATDDRLLQRFTDIRREFASQMGVLIPALRVRESADCPRNTYIFRLFGAEVARGEVYPNRVMVVDPPPLAGLEGLPGVEPTARMAALWVDPHHAPRAEEAGCAVVDPVTVMGTHLFHVLRQHSAELLGRQEVRRLLDRQKLVRPALVEDLVPNLLGLGEIQKVLRNLLRERLPIKNLAGILEALADGATRSKDPEVLTEWVRQALARGIAQHFMGPDGRLYVLTLSPQVEQALMAVVAREDRNIHAVLSLEALESLNMSLVECCKKMRVRRLAPLVLTYPATRPLLASISEQVTPELAVLSYSEVPPGIKFDHCGTVTMGGPVPAPRPAPGEGPAIPGTPPVVPVAAGAPPSFPFEPAPI